MVNSVPKQLILGFMAPLHSARFLVQKKSLLFLGVAPHVLNFIFYFWAVNEFVINRWMFPFLNSIVLKPDYKFISSLLNPNLFEFVIWMLAILLYGALGASFVNAVASPIYDYIAQKSYESSCSYKVPAQTIGDYIDSIISEITKVVIVFCVLIISLFLHLFAPILFILSIWYLGWNCIDRTLLLLNLPLRERIKFGYQNIGLCIGLGLWCYIPIVSTIFAFTTAAAGARLVATTELLYFKDSSPGADF